MISNVPFARCRERCAEAQEKFLQRCFYSAGAYDTPAGYTQLDGRMRDAERATGKVITIIVYTVVDINTLYI